MATKENDPTQALMDALRHPLRRALLHRYVTADEPTSPKYLANSMRQPLSSVSYHVRELAKLGVLERKSSGAEPSSTSTWRRRW